MTAGAGQQQMQVAAEVPPFSTGRSWTWATWRPSIRWAVAPLFLLDSACIALSMAAAYQLRFRILEYGAPHTVEFYYRLVLFAVPMWLLIFVLCRLYDPDFLFGGMQEYARVVNASTGGLVALILYTFLVRSADDLVSRGWLVIVWSLSVASLGLARFCYRRLIYYLRTQGLFLRRALVVGADQEGQAVAAQVRASVTSGVKVLGFVEPKLRRGMRVGGLPILGGFDCLGRLIRALQVDELIIIPTALRRAELLDIYRDWGTSSTVRLSLSSGLYELFTTGAEVREVGFVPMLSLNQTRITGLNALMKTMLDYVGALVGLVVLVAVLPIAALLSRRESPGPVVYRRRVVGLNGQEFHAYKLRTMIPDADAYLEAHPELKAEWDLTGKIQDDPRVTRMGRFLRRYSLDELPQLLNVLKGEMSLVGPRMITPAELEHFGQWRHNLLTVKPGLTGLWQVSGRADLSYVERVKMDMRYIRNYTIWLDLRILFNTIWPVLAGRGAY